ncbi:MAG: ankyrin repeat domain-containing protein [Alphaproteobacteria bacterium]|nr:ankyrin repeat domain-containing protein [Alphaproteobacteria bacterium]
MKKSLIAAFVVLFATQAQASVLELIESIKQNNLPEVLNLLDKGENVNAANEQGNTPLHYAVATDNAEIAEILLAKGADINAANAKGWTPLKIAEKKQVPNVLPILQKALQSNTDNNTVATKVSAAIQQQAEPVAATVQNTAEKVQEEIRTAENVSDAEKEQYMALIERAKEGILSARQELDAAQERNKELEAEIAKLKADKALLVKSVEQKSAHKDIVPAKTAASQTPKKQSEPVKSTQTTPKKPAQQGKVSVLNPQIFAGNEEIVYCLNYLGQGDDKNMLKAAGYYASTVGIGEARYNKIADLSNTFFASADTNTLKKRSDECSKLITPSNAEKQNMIIRSLNYAIGH